MERHAFELLSSMESSWWYRGRAEVVGCLLTRHLRTSVDSLLDYGAGSGGMIDTWKSIARRSYAFEPDEASCSAAAARGYAEASVDEKSVLARTYSVIAACDVIEHVEDDIGALSRIRTGLESGGVFVMTVPANRWLWSRHDVSHHHFRRYSRTSLKKALEAAGFDVVFLSHWNMFLFPVAVIMRLLDRAGEGALGLPKPIDSVLFTLIRIESHLMRFLPLPFGVSLVAVAVRR